MSLTVPVSSVIERARFSRYQMRVIAICLALGMAEGINALSVGYALPSLAARYEVPAAAFSIIFVAALIGEILGNFLLAPLGDKYGRRTMLRVGIIIFSLAAIPTVLVDSVEALAVCRFVAGFGIGAAVPSVIAMASDFAPNRVKGRVISIVAMSISAGGFLIGLVSASFIPAFGGAEFLMFGGILCLAILAVTWFALPESVEFLAQRDKQDRVWAILHRIDPEGVPAVRGEDAPRFVPAERISGARFTQLFREGRASWTLLLWALSFLSLFSAYFMFSFLATILVMRGIPDATALLTVSLATFGGMAGGVFVGFLMDRSPLGAGSGAVAAVIAIVGYVVLSIISPDASEALFLLLGFALGLGTGAGTGVQIVSTAVYPPAIRATGLGWASALGRVGGLIAPVLIGGLLGTMAPSSLLLIAIVPLVLSSVIFIVFFFRRHALAQPDVEQADVAPEVLNTHVVPPVGDPV